MKLKLKHQTADGIQPAEPYEEVAANGQKNVQIAQIHEKE